MTLGRLEGFYKIKLLIYKKGKEHEENNIYEEYFLKDTLNCIKNNMNIFQKVDHSICNSCGDVIYSLDRALELYKTIELNIDEIIDQENPTAICLSLYNYNNDMLYFPNTIKEIYKRY